MGLRKGCAIAARAMFGVLFVLLSGKVLAQTADTIVNWAASANGGAASASSTLSSTDYPAASLNDGAWLGSTFGHGDGWRATGTSKTSDWAQVTFAGAQTIHAVTVYSAPDGVAIDADGIESRTFTRVGVVDFDVQVGSGERSLAASTLGSLVLTRSACLPRHAPSQTVRRTHVSMARRTLPEA